VYKCRYHTYPDVLKIAKITPVHKVGSRTCISNYRPISILGNLNKIFEKVTHVRLNSYFVSQDLLSSSQFGFRRGVGTETAMLHLVSYALQAFEDRGFVLCVYMDFSKAFDTVNHALLLTKLDRYGVRGLALDLMKSYLNNRIQYVSYCAVSSEKQSVKVGVPQGSCLGPLLYSIYTNDLHRFIDNRCRDVMYADDTTLVSFSQDLELLKLRKNVILGSVIEWCNYNRLAVNVTKTKAMLFTNRLADPPEIFINNSLLEYVEEYKYLGVIFDPKLKYQEHIVSLQNRVSRFCGISYRLGSYFTIGTARSFYYAFFYSTASYCIVVWGGVLVCSQRGNRLENMQKRIVKNLFQKFYVNLAYNELLKEVELLKLVDIYKFRVGCMMYKMLKEGFCPALLEYIDPHTANHEFNTRNVNRFVLPLPSVENIRMNFKYQCLNTWNNIPYNIKTVESLKIFRINYKEYLLSAYE
jgi:hypothetical protein